jgi:hypothetical protein
MAKRVSSSSIGAFVLASAALAALVTVVLGSGVLLTHPHYFICMFQGNLNGLKIGSAVKVKGVQIGSVSKIGLRLTRDEGELRQLNYAQMPLPVIVELDERELKSKGGTGAALRPAEFQTLIQAGMRAQLNMESLLTGLLYIDLGVHPDQPARFYIRPGSGPYPEIPTIGRPDAVLAGSARSHRALGRRRGGGAGVNPARATRAHAWHARDYNAREVFSAEANTRLERSPYDRRRFRRARSHARLLVASIGTGGLHCLVGGGEGIRTAGPIRPKVWFVVALERI